MGKNQSASGLTNIIHYDNNGNITFVSGSTTLMSISSSGAITTTGVISGSNVLTASYANNAELLDGLDSTAFATTGAYSATSGSLYTVSSSAYATSGSLSATSGSLSAASGSFNTRVSALEATGSALSSSILSVSSSAYATSGSLSDASGSFNSRVASLETYSTNLTAKTASFATTGSNTFIGSQVVSGSLTASGSITATGTITAQTLVVQTITSSVVYSSGSNVFGNSLGNSQTFTGSVLITGSLTIAGASSATSYSGTTIYGSTAVCSAVGKFSTCLDLGGALTGTSATFSSCVTATKGTFVGTGYVLDLNRTDNTALVQLQYNGTIGSLLGTTGANNFIVYNASASPMLTLSGGAATFSSTITGTTIYGSTAVCSPVGKFTSCIDAGTGTFSGAVAITTALGLLVQASSEATIRLNNTGGGTEWRLNSYTNGNLYFQSAAGATNAVNFTPAGAATFSSTITGTTIYGSTAVCSAVGYFSGCVGIGTINPGTKLEVYRCETDRATVTRLLTLNNNSVANPYDGFGMGILFKGTDYSNAVQCYGAIDAVMEFSNRSTPQPDTGFCARMAFSTGTNGALTERMRISSGGNVGIGTASPCAKLHINGSTGASTYKGFAYTYAGSETLINEVLFQAVVGGYSSNLPIFLFKDERSDQGTTQRIFEIQGGRSGVGTILTTLASGNVGIGTSSPNFKTHISTGDTTSITQPTAGTYGLYVQQNTSGNVGGLYIQDGASNSGNSIYVGDNNGAARFVINTDGSVGIGICSPTHQLHVVNSVKFDTGLYFNNSAANGAFVWQIANESLRFGTCDTERMRIINSGNVGIGASSPAAKLHTCTAYGGSNTQAIFGNSNYSINSLVYDTVIIQADDVTTLKLVERNSGGVDQVLTMTVGDNSSRISTTCANQLQFFVGGSPSACGYNGLSGTAALTITGVGNVGIGTNSPQARLQVSCTANFGAILKISDTTTESTGIIALGDGNTSVVNVGIWRAAANCMSSYGNWLNLGGYDGILFATCAAGIGSQAERMRITSGGSVSIGSASAAYNFNVYGASGADGWGAFFGGGGATKGGIYIGNAGNQYGTLYFDNGNNNVYLKQSYVTGCVIVIANTGGVYLANGGTSWAAISSDIRKKKNFETTQGLAEVLQIEPIKYHFNEDDNNSTKRLGFKAQNIKPLIPEMVLETGEFAEDGSPYLTITSDYILPVLVKAIQEQQCTINTLKTCLGIS